MFIPTNVWPGGTPANAEAVTPDEFRRRQVAGEILVTTPDAQQARRTARQAHVAAEMAYLEGQTDLNADATALLAEAHAAIDVDAEPTVTLPEGQAVVLLSLATRIEEAAQSHREAHDPAVALAAYETSYALLTDALKATLPSPESLRGGTLDQIGAARRLADAAWASLPNLDNTRLDPDAPVVPVVPAARRERALTAGNGTDNDGVCAPKGLVNYHWFPLRGFVSPVKQQGSRGTCWAFAAIAAVESRERVQNNNPADLSEQFLINKYKLNWFPQDFVDGGRPAEALNWAVDANQPLMSEAGWTYNPAKGRPANSGDLFGVASYRGGCTGYNGWCSESAHEAQGVCTTKTNHSGSQEDYCAVTTMNFARPGVAPSRVRPVWSNGEAFDLNTYRGLLASGVSLLATFPVHEGFTAASAGVVSDYRKQMKNAKGEMVDGAYGSHAAQIVGFISNEEMSFPGAAPSNVGGGGYFILRNSWGCGGGDGGYYYVPADYVSDIFSSLKALDFDARRSTRWNDDQITPGGASGLSVDPKGATMAADLRVPTDLASAFTVSHPVANYVRLTVRSDRDGLLFDGQWVVNAPGGGSLFANSLPVNFQTEDLRTLTITARYGSQVVNVTKKVLVLNSPPSIRFETSGTPQQNESFVVNAAVTDINEANPLLICEAMTWAVAAPDTIVSGSGCTRVIRFGATGTRQVSVSTQDNEGRQASATQDFNVAPPPVNPYPRISSFGLYSRDYLRISNQIAGCVSNAVDNNALIDLRQMGCKLTLLGPDVSRYVTAVSVDNPAGEALSYDWTYTDFYPNGTARPSTPTARTATPSYDMTGFLYGSVNGSVPSAGVSTFKCTVDVRVNAPEVSRSKSLRVWSGLCINYVEMPR